MIPVLIPNLPETDAIVPYLRRIDEAHIYSNYGPLTNEFTARLCRFIAAQSGEGPVHAALTSNGTTAIELALRYRSAGRAGRYCVMPSWTFIATAHAAANVGLTPYFTDVDPETLALTPEIAARALRANPDDVAAIIVVSPCGAPIDVGAWEAFEAEHGVPVIFDAAAAALNLRHVGAQPLCVSLHATKALGIGEGGAIITGDAAMAAAITAMTGFGFSAGSRVSEMRGGNYRISEYAAAVGLAVLDGLDARIGRLREVSLAYVTALEKIGVPMQAGFGRDWLTMTPNAIFDAAAVADVTAAFDRSGVQWRRWYGGGCHTHPTFATCPHDGLPATRGVAETAIGVPFFPSIAPEQIAQVCGCVERILSSR
jgi:dTDP-4-amino-4,6-dideoxygalactose transaminase